MRVPKNHKWYKKRKKNRKQNSNLSQKKKVESETEQKEGGPDEDCSYLSLPTNL